MGFTFSRDRFFELLHGDGAGFSPEEIKFYIQRGPHYNLFIPTEILRKRYSYHGPTKQESGFYEYCKKTGINPYEHKIETHYNKFTHKEYYTIDGYRLNTYNLLFVDGYEASILRLSLAIKDLTELDDREGLAFLLDKYASQFAENEAKIKKCLGLDEHVEVESISYSSVNGMSTGLWKALHIDEYKARRSNLTYWIKTLEKNGDVDSADFLRKKYATLYVKKDETPTLDLDRANAFMDYILSDEFRREMIKKNRSCSYGD